MLPPVVRSGQQLLALHIRISEPFMRFLSVRSEVCLQLLSDVRLMADILAVRLCASSLPTRTRDFYPLKDAHAERTKSLEIYYFKAFRASTNLPFVCETLSHRQFKIIILINSSLRLYASSLPTRTRDFHPLKDAHAWRTKGRLTVLSAALFDFFHYALWRSVCGVNRISRLYRSFSAAIVSTPPYFSAIPRMLFVPNP